MGSIPYGPARVRNKKKMPKAGDVIWIREDDPSKTIYTNPWKQVIVDEVRDGTIFFVHEYP